MIKSVILLFLFMISLFANDVVWKKEYKIDKATYDKAVLEYLEKHDKERYKEYKQKITPKKKVAKVKPKPTVKPKTNTYENTKVVKKSPSSTKRYAFSAKTFRKGKKLFARCTGCHGTKAEKKALGRSKVVRNMSSKDIFVALRGYQKGFYGGSMKGIMKGQTSRLTKDDIYAISYYIGNLK
jgi:cytochrome c